jgi:hypothetical protein
MGDPASPKSFTETSTVTGVPSTVVAWSALRSGSTVITAVARLVSATSRASSPAARRSTARAAATS